MPESNNSESMIAFSPIEPLLTHMHRVYETVLPLPVLFEAMLADDWQAVKSVQKTIAEGENAAEALKREIRQTLHLGQMMPEDRRDVLEILMTQDQIADQAKDIAGVILSRKMSLPPEMQPSFLNLGQCCVDCVALSQDVIKAINEHLEAGLRGIETRQIEAILDTLNETENQASTQQRKLHKVLFEHEDEMSPIDVMFCYKIISSVARIADHAQHIGGRLQLMLSG